MITTKDIEAMVPTQKVVDGRRHVGKSKTRVVFDPRGFVAGDDYVVQMRLFSETGPWRKKVLLESIRGRNPSEIVENVQRWVASNIYYQSDLKTHGDADVWQTPSETLMLNAGDCEDGAILIASMLINAGINSKDVWIAVGEVEKGRGADNGYHAWVMLKHKGSWYPIDWCYMPQITSMAFRDPIEKRPCYISIDWMFNDRETMRRPVFGKVRKLIGGDK